jgi:mannuronan 5-epimerase
MKNISLAVRQFLYFLFVSDPVDLLTVSLFKVKGYFFLLSILPLLLLSESEIYPSPTQATTSESSCVTYDSSEEIISITCKAANLSGVYHQLKNPDLLRKEVDGHGVWLLNSGIVIEKDATLFINSTDTSWLKIISPSGGNNGERNNENLVAKANGIEVLGSLKIDSVKMTSWDPASNNYA